MFLMTILTGTASEQFHKKHRDSDEALDDLLIRLAANAEDTAILGEIYEIMRTPVYAYALSILKNPHDAEDTLHDALLCIHDAAHRYRSDGKPMAWIMTITKNLCYQKLRRQTRMVDLPEDAWDRYMDAAEEVTPEDSMTLRACMEKLSEEERQIVVMHAVADMKHREIAAILELPLSTVLAKYHRALKKLRNDMH